MNVETPALRAGDRLIVRLQAPTDEQLAYEVTDGEEAQRLLARFYGDAGPANEGPALDVRLLLDIASIVVERAPEPEPLPPPPPRSAERLLWDGSQCLMLRGRLATCEFSPLIADPPPQKQYDLEFLHEADVQSFLTHVLTLRAFLPAALPAWAEVLDRLYIKLQIPFYEVAVRDLETRSAREELDDESLNDLPLGSGGVFAALSARVLEGAPVGVEAENALAEYRRLLRDAFEAFAARPLGEFIEALRGPAPVAVDLARARLLAALRLPER